MKINKLYQWLAWKLPAGLVLWCYIRVVSLSGVVPIEYKKQYKDFVEKHGLKKVGF